MASHSSATGNGDEVRVAGGEEGLVVGRAEQVALRRGGVVDVDDHRAGGGEGEGLGDGGGELAVGDQHLRLGVVEDVGDGLRVEPAVERVQHAAGHRHAEMRLVELGRVGGHDRDGLARGEPGADERRGEAAAAGVSLGPAPAGGAVDHGGAVGKDRRRLAQETDGRKRHVVRGGAGQGGMGVGHGILAGGQVPPA
jgi:hypothetical protein